MKAVDIIRVLSAGFAYLYSLFFLTKFFDWSISPSYSLLIITIFPVLGYYLLLLIKTKRTLFLQYLSLPALLVLHGADTDTNLFFIVSSGIAIFISLQGSVLSILEENSARAAQYYAVELIGGALGTACWYFFSADLGFEGYSFIVLATHSINLLLKSSSFRIKVAWVGLLSLYIGAVVLAENPIVKKQRLTGIIDGQFMVGLWDPSAYVEFINRTSTIKVLFDQGIISSDVYAFNGDYSLLRKSYLNSESTNTWGLDVILPHYVFRNKNDKSVAIISAMGGQEILAAKAFNATEIFAVDINKSAQNFIAENLSNFTGDLYKDVKRAHLDGRYYIRNSDKKFDIIQIYSAHNSTYSSLLGYYLSPSSLITKEAFEEYIGKLKPSGILQVTQNQFQKIKVTFESIAQIGKIDNSKNFLILKKATGGNNLISFYYKNNGWSHEEISDVLAWLSKGQDKWVIYQYPSFKNQEHSTDFDVTKKLQSAPATDDWPFSKLEYNFFWHKEFVVLLIMALIAPALFFISFMLARNGSRANLFDSWCSGAIFSFNQYFVILFAQKIFGHPAYGLAVGSMLITIAMIAGFCVKNFSLIRHFKMMAGAALAVICFFLSQNEIPYELAGLVVFILITMFNSAEFLKSLLQKQIGHYFLVNSYGIVLGTALFNILILTCGTVYSIYIASFLLVSAFAFRSYISAKDTAAIK